MSVLLGSVVVGNVLAADMPDIPAINPDEGRIGEVRRVEDPTEFKVCADPDNMPYSNSKQEGFEDKIAAVLAKDLGKKLSFQYAYYRQGFLRNTLNANRCDVVMSTTSDNDSMRTHAGNRRLRCGAALLTMIAGDDNFNILLRTRR